MAISEVSQTYKSDPYVLPLSLDLLGKVLSVKQGKFDENAKRVQTGIDKLGALDILHPTKKAYANQKINELVNGINDLGGVDYGDTNIANQIDSLGKSIYDDPNVIEGLSATSSIRKLQEFYQNAKTDPKINKLYAVQNEYHDMNPVNQYLNNSDLNAQYTGGSTPSPYVPFKDQLMKNVEGVKANLIQSTDDNGNLIFTNKEHKEVSPEKIVQAARDLTTADQQHQMDMDADYQYRDADPRQIVTEAINVHNGKIASATATLQRYKDLYLQSTNDPLAHQNYELAIKEQEAEVNSLTSLKAEDFVKKYQDNPTAFKRGTYADQIYRGIGARFSYHEDRIKNTPNFATMFNLKMAQAERFHNDEMSYKEAELRQKGLKKNPDGTFQAADGTLTVMEPNTDDPNDVITGPQALEHRVDELSTTNTQLAQKFIAGYANSTPGLGDILESTQTGSGIAVKLNGQGLIENNNGIPGFQMDDLKDAATTKGLTPRQIEVFQGLWNSYDQLASGVDHGVVKFPKGFEQTVEQMQINNTAISANKDKLSAVHKQLSKEFGVTEDEIKLLDESAAHSREFAKQANQFNELRNLDIAGSWAVDPAIAMTKIMGISKNFQAPEAVNAFLHDKDKMSRLGVAIHKITNTSYEKRQQELFDQVQNRPTYTRPVVGEKYIGIAEIKDAKSQLADILSTIGGTDGKKITVAPDDNMHILSAGKGFGKYGYTVKIMYKDGAGPDAKEKTAVVPLSPDQVKQWGLQEGPYDALNDAVGLRGRTVEPLLVTAKLNTGVPGRTAPLRAKIDIVRQTPGDRNDFTSYAQLVLADGGRLNIPLTSLTTPAQAYAAAKAVIQQCEAEGLDYQGMIKKLTEESYKE